jgi:hypothetical protein
MRKLLPRILFLLGGLVAGLVAGLLLPAAQRLRLSRQLARFSFSRKNRLPLRSDDPWNRATLGLNCALRQFNQRSEKG